MTTHHEGHTDTRHDDRDLTPAQKLHRRICKAVLVERRAMREIALGLAEMSKTGLFREFGYARLSEYGEQEFGFGPSKTQQLASLGRRLPALPALDHAFEMGVLGWTKVRTLSQVIRPETEKAWVDRALTVNSRELERQVADALPGELPPEPDDGISPYQHVWATFRLDPFHFEQLGRALRILRQRFDDPYMSVGQMLLFLAELVIGGALDRLDALDEGRDASEEFETRGENAYPINYRIIEHRCP